MLRRLSPSFKAFAKPSPLQTAVVPQRNIFFGKIDNTSLEVIFRNMIRQSHIQRYLSNYFGKMLTSQEWPDSKLPVKIAPPACVSDPHRVLRLYSCLQYPVMTPEGKREYWYPEGHRERHDHAHGPLNAAFKRLQQEDEYRKQDYALHRRHVYEGDVDYQFPGEDSRGHALFWCEHYKIRVHHFEAVSYLAEELLKTLGRDPTPQAADEIIDELFDGTNPEILAEWRATSQRFFDELCFFRPTATRQWLEFVQQFSSNTTAWGGLYGSYLKNRRLMDPSRHDVDVLDPQFMFVNSPINDEALRQPKFERLQYY